MNSYLLSALIIFVYMVIWYGIALLKQNNGIVDVAWGLGFVCLVFALHQPFPLHSQLILMGMIGSWGIRLGGYLFLRNWNTPEDWRYRQWREEWGKNAAVMAFFKVFMLQGAVMWVIALPLMQVPKADSSSPLLLAVQGIGFFLWLFGFLWEAIADGQLMRFKSIPENKGRIMTSGLWRYSRHPNYFGEIVLWWGIFLFTIPFGHWYISILSPILMTWLLIRISGVAMLERKYVGNKAYEAYKEQTNALIPGRK